MRVEDGPGAAVVSEESGKNYNRRNLIFHKLSTGTPVIVSMRSEFSDKVKWYHEVSSSRLCKRRELSYVMAMSHARRIRYCAYACIKAQISDSANRAKARDEIDGRSMSTHGGRSTIE